MNNEEKDKTMTTKYSSIVKETTKIVYIPSRSAYVGVKLL